MTNGWIKLHRQFLKWEWMQSPKMVSLFVHLLLLANHEDGKWQGQEIKRGQLITGLFSLSEQTGISVQSLRTCLAKLEKTGELTSKSTNRYRIITIVNYANYQSVENSQQANQQTTNKQLTTNNKNKKNKKDNIYIAHQENQEFNEMFDSFKEMRRKIKKPLTTDRAEKAILNKLKDHHILIALKMLENSIINNWQGVFNLKPEEANEIYNKIEIEKPKETEHFTQEQIESNQKTLKSIRDKLLTKINL